LEHIIAAQQTKPKPPSKILEWAPHHHERVAGCDNLRRAAASEVSSVQLLPERSLYSQEGTSVAGRPHQQFMVRRRQVSIEKLVTKKLIQREAQSA
jgi:hypothetical protein